LWNIEPLRFNLTTEGGDDLLDAFEASLGDTGEGEEGGRQISSKRHIVSVKDPALPGDTTQKYSITFDALLVGHESGVTSLSWKPDGSPAGSPVLLSTSTDSSLILWSPFGSLWVNQNRFGDIGGQRLGGFVGGLWNADGEEILAWGWNGGWRRWRHDANLQGDAVQAWTEANAVTGHNNVVKDICWSPQGELLASTRFV
jgi:WD40 repeat protein